MTDLISLSIVLPFPEILIIEVIKDLAFYVSGFSHLASLLKCIPAVAHASPLFLFIT